MVGSVSVVPLSRLAAPAPSTCGRTLGWDGFGKQLPTVLGGVFFAGSPASQTFCAAKSRRRSDSFAPSKRNRRRVSAQRARTQQSRLLAAVPSGTSIRSVAQNCHRRNSFPPLNDKIGTEVCLAHRRSSKRATTHGSWLFCWTSGVLGTPPFRFYHLTAEMNSAYGNSALRFELTYHLARPPEGGFAGFVPFGRSPFGDCACSERMNRSCAEILLRKTFETPDFRRKTPHPRPLAAVSQNHPTQGSFHRWRELAPQGD